MGKCCLRWRRTPEAAPHFCAKMMMIFNSQCSIHMTCRPAFLVCQSLLLVVALSGASLIQAQMPPLTLRNDKVAKDGLVWGALIYASDKPSGNMIQEAPREFLHLFTRLGKVFPYSNFRILGQHDQIIFREFESWMVPSKEFFVKLDSKGPAKGGGIQLQLQFWQGTKVLLKADSVLRWNSPLFIGGPKWRDGRLVFVLILKELEPEIPRVRSGL